MKNHYDILGLSRSASKEEIKTAYRKLSTKFHPDKNNGETFFAEMFKQINEAYNALYDPIKRAKYDKELYDFEHPPKLNTSYQGYTTPEPKVKTQPAYTYSQPTTSSISVWDGVRRWKTIRNYLLGINGVLLFILFITRSATKSQISEPLKDSLQSAPKAIVHKIRHKKRRVHTIDTTSYNVKKDTSMGVKTSTPLIQETQNKESVDTTSAINKQTTEPNFNNNVQDTPKKKKGFFKRLFGKKTN